VLQSWINPIWRDLNGSFCISEGREESAIPEGTSICMGMGMAVSVHGRECSVNGALSPPLDAELAGGKFETLQPGASRTVESTTHRIWCFDRDRRIGLIVIAFIVRSRWTSKSFPRRFLELGSTDVSAHGEFSPADDGHQGKSGSRIPKTALVLTYSRWFAENFLRLVEEFPKYLTGTYRSYAEMG
jgi:hypothetical protein